MMTIEVNDITPSNKLDLIVPEEKLAKIITEFLGEKEKLIYEDNCYFTVELNDIIQFNHLLSQKISKEHNSHISFFSTEITYKNKTKRVFHNIESLITYNEPSNLIPKSITLTWNIIFKFPNNETAETQKIRVFFNTTSDVMDGYVSLTIEHTNPSWGSEIQHLFVDHIKQLVTRSDDDSKLYDSLIRSEGFRFLSYLIVTVLYFLTFMYNHPYEPQGGRQYTTTQHIYIEQIYELSNKGKIKNNELLIAADAIRNMNNGQLSSAIEKDIFKPDIKDIALKYISSTTEILEFKRIYNWIGLSLYFLVIMILHLYFKSYLSFYKHKSFLLITDYSKKRFDEHNRNVSKFQFYGLSALMFTIISGLVTNFLTPLLTLFK